MVFHWSLRDSKSPQISRTLLSIRAVLNNAVVWMVSTRPPTSNLLLLLFLLLNQHYLMVFHWSLTDRKSSQIFGTLLSISTDLNNAVVWMVSNRPLVSKSSSPCTKSFGDDNKCANYNWYHRHFRNSIVFHFSCRVYEYISLLAFHQFYLVVKI